MLERRGFGRCAETARLVLVALREGPRQHVRLFDDVRALSAYLESLPEPRRPAEDRKQVARGKKLFDSDPGGRKGIATGHTVSRNVDNPNDVFIRTEYKSVEDAKRVRQQLLDSGALNRSTVKTPPTIIVVNPKSRVRSNPCFQSPDFCSMVPD